MINRRLLLVAIVGLCITLTSCTTQEKKDTLTISDIREMYNESEIINTTDIGKDFILVESKNNGFTNKFDVYNLNTGEKTELPTQPRFTELVRVTDENNITLLATGKNSEISARSFPYLLNYQRDNDKLEFVEKKDSYFLDINEGIAFGDESKYALISYIEQDKNKISICFIPSPGREADFFAGSSFVPLTDVSFNKDEFMLNFKNTLLGEKVSKKMVNNEYFSIIEPVEDKNSSTISVKIENTAMEYTIDIKDPGDGKMYENIIFRKQPAQ